MGWEDSKARPLGKEKGRIYEEDLLYEKCAVFGVFSPRQPASALVHVGLATLQHRGQDASGITSSDGNAFFTRKAHGLVSSVFMQQDITRLSGPIAIGHNRYATSGGADGHLQPISSKKDLVALVHNGNLPETKKLQAFLRDKHISTRGLNDSEMMQRVIEYQMEKGLSVEDAIKSVYSLFTGAFALVLMTKDKLIGLRDSHGVRPLSIGKMNGGGYALSSETFGLERIHAKVLRDVGPGEMVVVDREGLHSHQIEKGEEKLDIFEAVYFARPESTLYGMPVNRMRRNMGKQLAYETKDLWERADMIFAVPNSSIPAAAGYAEASRVWYEADALIKDAYAHRTFINANHLTRAEGVRRKFSPMGEVMRGKRIILVDDSIVRGTTLRELVKMLKDKKQGGAKEVYVVISSPPVKYPDFYGIATPDQKDLIASHMSVKEIQKYIGADELRYLSYPGMIAATGIPEEKFNTSCFTGIYPIDIGEQAKAIDFTV